MRILRLSKLNDHFTRYDLSIDGIHNFVAEGVVVHNTSAHVAYNGETKTLTFFSGGESHANFLALFDQDKLLSLMTARFGNDNACIYGEAYGGSQQGMSQTYGKQLRFACFDVEYHGRFLDLPDAEAIVKELGLEFVDYERVSTDLSALDAQRDRPSVQAERNGCAGNKDRFGFCPPIREGVVLRPIKEFTDKYGNRVICKHKRPEFQERQNQPKVVDADKQKVLDDAEAVATEWVVAVRLEHVLDKLGNPNDITMTGKVSQAMVEDVMREASGEIADTKEIRKAIGARAAKMYKDLIKKVV